MTEKRVSMKNAKGEQMIGILHDTGSEVAVLILHAPPTHAFLAQVSRLLPNDRQPRRCHRAVSSLVSNPFVTRALSFRGFCCTDESQQQIGHRVRAFV